MMRVKIIKDGPWYALDYMAWLTGWVVLEGKVHAIVFTDDGDTPWPVPIDLVEMTV